MAANAALSIDLVLEDLRRIVSAAASESEASGRASYEAVQAGAGELRLHALRYIGFLEDHGYVSYDRGADRIDVSEAGHAAIEDSTIWETQAMAAFSDQLEEDSGGDDTSMQSVDDLLDAISEVDLDFVLDEVSEVHDANEHTQAGRFSLPPDAEDTPPPPGDGTSPDLDSLDDDPVAAGPKTPRPIEPPQKEPAPKQPAPAAPKDAAPAKEAPAAKPTPAKSGTDMANQDFSSRRLGTQNQPSVGSRGGGATSSSGGSLYEREEEIGSGGMGTVFKSRQTKLDRLVAVKEIKEIFDVFAGVQRSDIVERFTEIVQTQSRLLHPNIIQVIDIDTDAQFPFVVMQYAPNGNLRRLIDTPERPPLQIALKYFLQILHALNTAHDHGVTHGGIKPENVVLDHAGNALVTDFGISGVAELDANRGATQVYVGVGTVAYMSPEQFRDPNSSSVKTDIYSLGIMFYEMLTGKVPGRRSPMPSSFFPDIPRTLDDIFDRMSMDDANDRYDSIDEILADIYAAEEVMEILDKRGGFVFLRDPMQHGAVGIAAPSDDDDDEPVDAAEYIADVESEVAADPSFAADSEGDEAESDDEDGEDGDVLGKLDKYGELFDEEDDSDADDSDADDEDDE